MVDTPQQVIDFIRTRSKELGSLAKFAREYNIEEEVHMSAWVNRKRSIPQHVLNAFGWERITVYREIKHD